VAGGYDDTSPRFLGDDAEAYCRGWSGFGAEVYLDSVAGNYLGGRGSKVLGGKAGVIAYNEPPGG